MLTELELATARSDESLGHLHVAAQQLECQQVADSAIVRETIRARRRRSKIFGDRFFSDPAWDLLLVLYVAQLEQRRISIGDACASARVAMTTALRWFEALGNSELVKRRNDPFDSRRVYIELADEGLRRMHNYFGPMRANRVRL